MHWDIIHTSSLEFKQIFSIFQSFARKSKEYIQYFYQAFILKKKNNLRKTKTLILQLWREAKEGGKNFPWNEKERKRENACTEKNFHRTGLKFRTVDFPRWHFEVSYGSKGLFENCLTTSHATYLSRWAGFVFRKKNLGE